MGTDLPGKNASDPVTLEEQNLLMNSTEIVVSVYNGTTWTSTRLTNDGTPDLAPATAVGGDGKGHRVLAQRLHPRSRYAGQQQPAELHDQRLYHVQLL